MVSVTNTRIIFNSIPTGFPEPGKTTITDRSEAIDLDSVPLNGGILVKAVAISVDPYMRLLMKKGPSNPMPGEPPNWVVGQPAYSIGVARVLRSEDTKFIAGQHVYGFLTFSEYSVVSDTSQHQILPEGTRLPWSTFLGIAGLTGMTAYSSWKEYANAKPGQVVFISAGAGAVGSVVIQLAKQDGLKVIASAGSDEKVEFMKTLGADITFNYKTQSTREILSKEGPINIYYDNVGGDTLEAALDNAASYGRVIICGSVSGYNGEHAPVKNFFQIHAKHLLVQGFTVMSLIPRYAGEFYGTIPMQAAKGEWKWKEHIYWGLDEAHQAMLDVQTGKNEGKAVVVLNDD